MTYSTIKADFLKKNQAIYVAEDTQNTLYFTKSSKKN